MTAAPRTLAQMQFYATAYEVIAKHEDGRETRLAFTERKTKRRLLDLAFSHCDSLIEFGAPENVEPSYSKTGGWKWGPVAVRFSGLTERDCATA